MDLVNSLSSSKATGTWGWRPVRRWRDVDFGGGVGLVLGWGCILIQTQNYPSYEEVEQVLKEQGPYQTTRDKGLIYGAGVFKCPQDGGAYIVITHGGQGQCLSTRDHRRGRRQNRGLDLYSLTYDVLLSRFADRAKEQLLAGSTARITDKFASKARDSNVVRLPMGASFSKA